MNKNIGPKVLILDIETAPVLGYVWGLWDNNLGLNQVKQDWYILSWAAKWLDDPAKKTMYQDQRGSKNIEKDRTLLEGVWKLLNECDVLVTQNGKAFDHKKLNARFILNGMKPPSSYKHIDTLLIAKKIFAFTSNKLEYMSSKLCSKYQKQTHRKYAGFELWKECLSGNKKAWQEMEKYNKYDVLSLEELYKKMIPWDTSINFNLYSGNTANKCKCGSSSFVRNGHAYTSTGKYQRFTCTDCGAETRGRQNVFSKEKRKSLTLGTVR